MLFVSCFFMDAFQIGMRIIKRGFAWFVLHLNTRSSSPLTNTALGHIEWTPPRALLTVRCVLKNTQLALWNNVARTEEHNTAPANQQQGAYVLVHRAKKKKKKREAENGSLGERGQLERGCRS